MARNILGFNEIVAIMDVGIRFGYSSAIKNMKIATLTEQGLWYSMAY